VFATLVSISLKLPIRLANLRGRWFQERKWWSLVILWKLKNQRNTWNHTPKKKQKRKNSQRKTKLNLFCNVFSISINNCWRAHTEYPLFQQCYIELDDNADFILCVYCFKVHIDRLLYLLNGDGVSESRESQTSIWN